MVKTLKRHLPFFGKEGLQELEKISVRFEEEIYTAASSQLRIGDMQQRLLQQNNLQNLQQQQQQLMAQQNNLSTMHQQQLGPQNNAVLQQRQQQQQQLLGSQSGNSGMPCDQHFVHMLQQPKVPMQQQSQQGGTVLLASQGQQTQSQAPQQQLVSSATQLQQQLGLQQQSNSVQRDSQQRLQGPGQATGSLLQTQSANDHQKQLCQSQRTLPNASASLDPAAQSGQVNVGDWQEEAYQKVKQMKDAYYHELTELYHKVAAKLQQHESMPQQPKSDQHEKLKMFKQMVERLLHVLQTPKSNINPAFKDKLGQYEKQILSFLNSNRPRKPMQQGLAQLHMQNLQQPQSQVSQVQSQENHMNPQLQSMTLQGSTPKIPQNSMSSLQHNSLPSVSGVSASQQNVINPLQPGSNLDSGQGSSLGSVQQVYSAMVVNNGRAAAPGREASLDPVDWRSQLQPDSRQQIVNKIAEILKKHLPFSGEEGLQELKKIAMRFEEKIYTVASSQPDYLQRISLKMLTMESKSQNTIPISEPAGATSNSNRFQDTGA